MKRKKRFIVIGFLLLLIFFLLLAIFYPIYLSDPIKKKIISSMYSEYRRAFTDVSEVSFSDIERLSSQGMLIFVDTREDYERSVSMIQGAISEKNFEQNMDSYSGYTVIVYCTIGDRSGRFASRLKAKGIRVYNISGGILSWIHSGGKLYSNGKEANRVHVFGKRWALAPYGYESVW